MLDLLHVDHDVNDHDDDGVCVVVCLQVVDGRRRLVQTGRPVRGKLPMSETVNCDKRRRVRSCARALCGNHDNDDDDHDDHDDDHDDHDNNNDDDFDDHDNPVPGVRGKLRGGDV